MGLITKMAMLPVAPVRFSVWVAQKVSEQAEREHFSTGAGVRKLQEIEHARAQGQIDEEKAAELEGQVLEQQLGAAQNRRSGSGGSAGVPGSGPGGPG